MKSTIHRGNLFHSTIPFQFSNRRAVCLIAALAAAVCACIFVTPNRRVRAKETTQSNVAPTKPSGGSLHGSTGEFEFFGDPLKFSRVNPKRLFEATPLAESQFIESRKLITSDGALGDDFGHHLAMDGNYLVVAAASKQIGTHQGQGAVYVFVRDGTSWVEQQRLTDSAGHGFGSSVAIDGDTIAIGSPSTDGALQLQGAVYVYVRNGTSWVLQEKLMASNATLWDFMGTSVDIDGNTIVAGAPSHFVNPTSPGSAYVFTREGSNWTQRRKLTLSDGVLKDAFGYDVGIDNGTIVVSSPLKDFVHNGSSRVNIGAAYIFTGGGSTWTERQRLTGLDSVSNDNVGWSVAIDGSKLVISAPGDDFTLKSNQGSAYVFNKTAAGWVQQQKIFASDGQEDDHFGVVAIKGSMIAVGVELADIGAEQTQGSAYIFDSFGSTWVQRQKLTSSDFVPNDLNGDRFGADVAVGNTAVVVGARRARAIAHYFDGAAYVFTNNESCSYSVSPSDITLSAASGDGSFLVNASNFCQWTATTSADWLLINEPADGSGNGVVNFTVAANNTESSRSATIFLEDQVVSVTQSANNQPLVTAVIRTYPGFFLDGFDHNNNFDVRVDWRGTPGRVRFQVNNNAPFEVQGNADGAVQPFNLDTSFPVSLTPSTIKITPINGDGVAGATRTEEIHVFPYPVWLQSPFLTNPSVLTFSVRPGEVRADIKLEFPSEPYRALIPIPSSVPFIGGQFGVRETQGSFTGFVSSTGSGQLTLTGSTGFVGMGQRLDGSLSGSGDFLLNQDGLSLAGASFDLSLSGTVRREVRLIDAIPFLSKLSRFKVVRQFAESVKLGGELRPSFDIGLSWKQDPTTQDLVFNEGTGQIGVEMKGVLSAKITDRITFEGWLAGGGSVTVGAPAPFARRLDLNFEAGAQFSLDYLFRGYEFKGAIAYQCTWTPADGEASCSGSDSSPDPEDGSSNPELNLIRTPYGKFGGYESFKADGKNATARVRNGVLPTAASEAETTLVGNVFAGAEPTLLPVGCGGKMLLWVRQNTDLPVLQSTEIAWSYYDGTGWSEPAVIVSDSRAEFSPVAGVDENGKVVAAWLRIKAPSFDTPIPTFDELPLFYREVEVVSAVFDPGSRAWSAQSALTNDGALDTSLRLSRDNNGKLLLTWQSNPSGEFTADAANPASLKYSFWNGSGWNAPATVADNLSNVGEHAVALKGNKAFIVLPQDPNFDAANDSRLVVYGWNGTAWDQGAVFAAGGVDNQAPMAVYDAAGEGRVVWLRGADLVRAKLSDHAPQVVRQGSESTAFRDVRLFNNAADNLTLIWHEVVDNGPANIFAKIYDPTSDTWGEDRRLNEDPRRSENVAGYYDRKGDLHLTYLATEILRVTKTVDINGQSYEIPNVPENGQTDLCVLTVSMSPLPAPAADAGPDQTFSCLKTSTQTVTLDATGSLIPVSSDSAALSYTWSEGATVLGTGPTAEVQLAPGTHTITLSVSEACLPPSTDTVTVSVSAYDSASCNTAPGAVDDAKTLPEDSAATVINVLSNDTDFDPADPKTIVAKTDGSHGVVTITGGGTGLTYTPAANFYGTDTFTYRISDGDAASPTDATVTVTVTEKADTPTVGNATTAENTQSGFIPVTKNAADGAAVSHFRVTSLTNGKLYLGDGTTPVLNNTFVAFSAVGAGLKFTPTAGLSSPGSTFSFKAQASVGATTAGLSGSLATSTITVAEGGVLKLSAATYSAGESAATATVTVTRTGGSGGAASVKYNTTNGTATGYTSCAAGKDYVTKTGTLSWAAGETVSKTFTIPICNDVVYEGNETINLTLSNATGGAGLGTPQTAVLTIVDNETQPKLSVNSVTVSEGNSGSTNAVFTVKLSGASSRSVTVKYQTANVSAVAPADYTALALTTLTFLPGQTSKTVAVAVKGDLIDEADETFKLALSSPTGATIASGLGAGVCTIKDNDAATISINNVSVAEPDASTVALTFTVKLSVASSRTVSVKYATANGTATATADYTALALTTLSFSPGLTSRTVTVQVKGDTLKEANETLFVNLSAPASASIADAQGLGTILNDD